MLLLVLLLTISSLSNCYNHNNNNRIIISSLYSSTTSIPFIEDKINAQRFHHVELYCGDATSTYKRFILGLGMDMIAKSDLSTGNNIHASYALQSGQMTMLFTAPYSISSSLSSTSSPLPGFDCSVATDFFTKHGLGVRAVCIEVEDVYKAYETIMLNKGKSVLPPQQIYDHDKSKGYIDLAEVSLYGDVVLRLINSSGFKGNFIPNFNDIKTCNLDKLENSYGLTRFDHVVGNLWALEPAMSALKEMTGFHEFAEFVADDVGTVDSGLNSVVLANKDEMVLLPLNEPTFGTKRKSQIQTYLEQNKGEGVQHMALFTPNIFDTLQKMKAATRWGGLEFMDPQPKSYYRNIRNRIGDSLTDDQYEMIEKLGLLADKDDKEGILLQIFTKPIGDRPTLFLEIIQRIGCVDKGGQQKAGCGGFGKGNFRDLFKSIEDYEKTLKL